LFSRPNATWSPNTTATDYVLIRTELVDANGVVTIPFHQFAAPVSDGCEYAGEMDENNRDYDTIRHVTAVDPVEVRVPFVLTDLPIPAL
jgi:hypothetical protein